MEGPGVFTQAPLEAGGARRLGNESFFSAPQLSCETSRSPARIHGVTHPSAEFLDLQAALAGEYSLERELGRGGMGVVYLARDVQLDRDVAIKVLPAHLAAHPGGARAVRARGAHGRRALAPAHRPDPSRRRGGRLRLLRHELRRGRDARRATPRARSPAAGRRDARAARGGVGARLRARTRHRAPRREAGQHPARGGHGPRAGDRLRHRPWRSRSRLRVRSGEDHGDRALHESRAGGGRRRRRTQRHLRARRGRVPRGERPPAVRVEEPARPAGEPGDRGAAERNARRPRAPARARRGDRPVSRPRPG